MFRVTFLKILLLLIILIFPTSSFAAQGQLTVVFNNVPLDRGLLPAWGFGCVIEGFEKTLLFDTGSDGGILTSNMKRCSIDPAGIDSVILSHEHYDHVGGLEGFLKSNGSRAEVYFPAAFTYEFQERIREWGSRAVGVDKPLEICRNVWSTGELGKGIREQSLVLETEKGLVIITGCAHPGIVHIVETVARSFDEDIYLVMGGFHLTGSGEEKINSVIQGLRELGVLKIAPSHCTGDLAIKKFQSAWGKDFIQGGCGASIVLDLKNGGL